MPAKFVKLNLATGMQVAAQSDVADLAASTSAALGVGSLELGHASDTTLSRSAAGVLAVEGNQVPSPASPAQGDIIYYNGTSYARLAAGTSGHFLKTQGAGANPVWDAASAGAMTLITSASASNSATVDFTTAAIFNGTYKNILVIVSNLVPATVTYLIMRVSQSSSFKSDGGYHYAWNGRATVNTIAQGGGSSTETGILTAGTAYPCGLISNSSSEPSNFSFMFTGSGGTAGTYKVFRTESWASHYNGGITSSIGVGCYRTNTSALDGIRFLMSSGNITSGNFYVYGIA